MIEIYERVRVLTDRYDDEGVHRGSLGYVIERLADGAVEVEVSDSEGWTIASVVLKDSELEPAVEGE